MLLSQSRMKKKNEPTMNIPRKSLRTSRNQTNPSQEIPVQSNSDSKDSIDTPPRQPKMKSELKLRIRYKVKEQNKDHHNLHVQLLQFLVNNVTPTITVFNKKHKVLKTAAVMALSGEEIYRNHFDIHYSTLKNDEETKQAIIIQYIQINLTLSAIKNQPGVLAFLKTNKIYINIHEWTPTNWDVTCIGFLSKFLPSHHPKELALLTITTKFAFLKQMPQSRLKQVTIRSTIYNKIVSIKVYAIETVNKDTRAAEKLFLKHAEDPDEFIAFKMQKINQKAFNNAIALVAQHQNNLRTVVINNISKEAYFVLEGEARQMEHVLTVHHLSKKKSVRLITYE
jgi:hypothetical protein